MKKFLTRLSLILLFIFLTTYQSNNQKDSISILFPIKKILIENQVDLNKDELLKKLNFLYGKNLLFTNEKQINDVLIKFDLISSAVVKKIYPSTLNIFINEKKLVAIIIKNDQRFFLSNKGELVAFFNSKIYQNLPNVFGNDKNFYSFYQKLLKTNFDIKEIKSYYFFESNRWDILMNDGVLIKLPILNYEKILIDYQKIGSDLNFKNYKIFDYRIKDQLIFK